MTRAVSHVHHFDPRPMADLRAIEDPEIRELMLQRRPERPFGHDRVTLKCSHSLVVVRTAEKVLYLKLPCRTCARLTRERELASKRYATRPNPTVAVTTDEEHPMATKSAKKSNGKGKSGDGTSRAWNQTYEFRKALKAEPPKDTIKGCVYAGIKKVGKGNVDEVTEAAMRAGLGDVTGQDPRTQTQVWLRALIADGAVTLHKHTGEAKAAVAKKPVKKGKRLLVVKKSGKAPAQATA